MREVDIHDVFERFRSGGPLMIPVGPDEARRVSNRRRRGRIAVTTAAVVLAAAAPVVAYALVPREGAPDAPSSPTPTVSTTSAPTPSASASPSPGVEPTGVPAAVTLQQSDVPTGFEYMGSDIDGDWTLEFVASLCEPPNNMGGAPDFDVHWGAAYLIGSGPEGRSILQRVDQYSVSGAEAYVQAVRDMAQGCGQGANDPMTLAVVQEDFAGDDSLVVSAESAGGHSIYVVVRAGELVTQIWYKDSEIPDPVLLGRRAAARLCEGTTAC